MFDALPRSVTRVLAALPVAISFGLGACSDAATAPSRDGGRDAYGYYKLGPESDPIRLDFALEAKCYGADNGVGVRDLSRLISRLRHRQFGVLVTTSYLAPQALMVVYEAGKCMVSVPRLGGAGVDLYRPIAPSRTRPTAETRARTSLTSISIIRAFSSLDGDVRRRGEA